MGSSIEDQKQSLTEQIEHIEQLLKDSPEDPWLALQLGQLYLANGQFLEAENLVRGVLDCSSAESIPEVVAACFDTLGFIALLNNDHETAITWLTSALQVRESLSEPELLGWTCYHLASAYLVDEKLQQAIDLLERTANLLPRWALVHDALAKVYHAAGMLEEHQQAAANLGTILAKATEQTVGDISEFDEAQRPFTQGVILEIQGDYERAVDEFEKAIAAGFTSTELYRRLGICLSELERFPEAVRALKRSIEIDPAFPVSHFDLALVYQRLGMTHAEMKEYERTIELAPTFVDAYINLIYLHLQADRPELAQAWAERAIKIDDTNDRVYYLYGQTNLAQGRLVEGYNAWRKALELVQEEHLREDYEDRVRSLEQKILPSTCEQRAAAIEILSEGLRLRDDGQPEAAIAHFKRACQADPHFTQAHVELAFAHLNANRPHEAEPLFEQLTQEHPENQEAQLGLGMALVQVDQPHEARHVLSKAYDLAPQTRAGKEARAQLMKLDVQERFGSLPVQRYEEALNHMDAGQPEQAIEAMREAVTLAPNVGLFCGGLGWLYLLTDRVDDAIRQFELATDIEPQEATHYCNLGTALLKQGKAHEAMPLLQKAIALDPSQASFHNVLGTCYAALDNDIVAEVEFRKAVELDPDQPDAWRNLCQNLIRRTRYEQAADEVRKIVELFQGSPFAQEAQKWLETLTTGKQWVLEQAVKEEVAAEDSVSQLCDEGEMLYHAGYIASALEKYQEAAAEDFEAFDPHFLMGNAYARLGQHDRAISEFTLATTMQATESQKADACHNMANSYLKLENFEQAANMSRKAIETYPGIRDARVNLSLCLVAQGRYEEAIELIREELHVHPDKERAEDVHFNLAQWLLEAGRDSEALFEFKKAILIDPQLGVLREQLGRILLSKRLWNLAQAEFETVLEMEPDNEDAQVAVEALRFVEYEVPWLVVSDSPRVKHSLKRRDERIQERAPSGPRHIFIDFGERWYEKRRTES